MAGISQSKHVWHSTAMRSVPPVPSASRAMSRSAASMAGTVMSREREQTLAGRRERDRRRLAHEERDAEVRFEGLELVRQRGLREMQPLRRARQRAGIAQREQGLQMAEFERRANHGSAGVLKLE